MLRTLGVLLALVLGGTASPVPAAPGGYGPITLRVLPGRTYAVRPHRGAYEGVGEAFRTLSAWMADRGLAAAGPALAVFFDDPKALPAEKLRSEARIPVRVDEARRVRLASGPCFLRRDPPLLVLRTVHRGPYANLGKTFDALFRAVAGRGIRYRGPMRQVFRKDPARTRPEEREIEAQIVVEPTGRSDVAIYAGRGTFGPGLLALGDALSGARITFRPVTAPEIEDGRLGKRARILLVPGGWVADYRTVLGEAGAARIRRFVETGGGYLGICAGAFFAADRIVWKGEELACPLDLFPGVPRGPIPAIAPWPRYALTRIRLDPSHPVTRGLGKERTVLYYGGPALVPGQGARVAVLARSREGGQPAVVAFSRGRGRVLLSGIHPEIRLGPSREAVGWPGTAVEQPDPEGDRDLLVRGIRWLLRR